MAQLTDESPMPFGKHKGKKLANVPADYLLWIYGSGILPSFKNLEEYIEENMNVLKQEMGRVTPRYPKYTRSK